MKMRFADSQTRHENYTVWLAPSECVCVCVCVCESTNWEYKKELKIFIDQLAHKVIIV